MAGPLRNEPRALVTSPLVNSLPLNQVFIRNKVIVERRGLCFNFIHEARLKLNLMSRRRSRSRTFFPGGPTFNDQ